MDNAIKNSFDFDYKVDFIMNNYNETISDKLQEQNNIMSSSIMNSNFIMIETCINNLYEKIRLLEDVMDYANIYMNNEINGTILECKDLLVEIENMNNNIFNDTRKYIAINVPFVNNDQTLFTDRNGAELKRCEPVNGSLMLSGTVLEKYNIYSVSASTNIQVYERNIEALKCNGIYRAHYLIDYLIDIGIIEKLLFNFEEPIYINNINIKMSNCGLKEILYIYEDNSFEKQEDFESNAIAEKRIKGVQISLHCHNYKPINIPIPIKNQIKNYIDDINIEKELKILDYRQDVIEKSVSSGMNLEFINTTKPETIIEKDIIYQEYIDKKKLLFNIKNDLIQYANLNVSQGDDAYED